MLPKRKRKKKTIALQVDDKSENANSSSDMDCDKIAMLSKRLKNMLRKKHQKYGTAKVYKIWTKMSSAGEKIICYKCKKPRHIKGECPEITNESSKKDAEKTKEMESQKTSKEEKASELSQFKFGGFEWCNLEGGSKHMSYGGYQHIKWGMWNFLWRVKWCI